MTAPALAFGVLVAAAMAAGIHARWGRGCLSLLLLTLAAEVGFWAGHGFAAREGWTWGKWGPLHLLPGVLGALALTGLLAFLMDTPAAQAADEERR